MTMTFQEGQERLAKAMLRPVNPTAIILLGTFTVVWGFWVGNPFWTVFSHAALYSFMSIFPEWVWGTVAVVCGLVIIHGAYTRHLSSLVLGAKVGGMFWFVISIMFFLGDWMNTGGITALLLAIYSAFIYLNLKVNSLHVDDCSELFTK